LIGAEIPTEIVAEACSLEPNDIEVKGHRPCIASRGIPLVFAELTSRAGRPDADTAHDDDIGPRVDRSVIGLAREVGHRADGGCDGLTICRPQALRVLRSAT
jgi:hypothetical protein